LQVLWRSAYYKLVVWFRTQIADVNEAIVRHRETRDNTSLSPETRKSAEETLITATYHLSKIYETFITFLKEGVEGYRSIIDTLQQNYKFTLNVHIINDLKGSLDQTYIELLPLQEEVEESLQSFKNSKVIKQSILTCHRSFICAGDLERYMQQYASSASLLDLPASSTTPLLHGYRLAASYYCCARGLIYRNSKPYNQLAVVSLHEGDYFSAVYFYIRSLLVMKPILTARDRFSASLIFYLINIVTTLFFSLTQVFESVKTKNNDLLESVDRLVIELSNIHIKEKYKRKSFLKEVWIIDNVCKFDSDERHKEKKERKNFQFSFVDFDKYKEKCAVNCAEEEAADFLLLYHGALFSRTGVERFFSFQHNFLNRVLFAQKTGTSFSTSFLLRGAVICIFSCEERMDIPVKVSGTPLLNADEFPALTGGSKTGKDDTFNAFLKNQENVLWKFSFSFLIEYLLVLIQLVLANTELVKTVFPCIKIIFLWFVSRKDLVLPFLTSVMFSPDNASFIKKAFEFYPELFPKSYKNKMEDDDFYILYFWKLFSDLLNFCDNNNNNNKNTDNKFLWEDLMVLGIKPLSDAYEVFFGKEVYDNIDIRLINDSFASEITRRITILGIGTYIVSELLPIYEYDYYNCCVQNCGFFSQPTTRESNRNTVLSKVPTTFVTSTPSPVDTQHPTIIKEFTTGDTECQESSFTHLKEKQQQLIGAIKTKQTYESLLSEKRNEESIAVVIHVAPVNLVFDTNCFISYLPIIQKLLNAQKFTIICPLVVFNEITGLTKGEDEGSATELVNRDRVNFLKEKSREALIFLKKEFALKNPFIKMMTFSGNVLNTLKFRNEQQIYSPQHVGFW
jgi:hypothetical protein